MVIVGGDDDILPGNGLPTGQEADDIAARRPGPAAESAVEAAFRRKEADALETLSQPSCGPGAAGGPGLASCADGVGEEFDLAAQPLFGDDVFGILRADDIVLLLGCQGNRRQKNRQEQKYFPSHRQSGTKSDYLCKLVTKIDISLHI